MKKSKKPSTPKALKSALDAAGFKYVKVTKVTPPKTVKVKKSAIRRQARAAERRKAKLVSVPLKYKKALSQYGLGRAQTVIRRRGRYYTAAGVYDLKRFDLSVKAPADVQNVFSWHAADRRGWYIRVINGVPQKKLARWAAINQEQKRAWKSEKIRVVAEKTGVSKTKIREVLKIIRAEESKKLARFKRTKKFKKLTSKEKKRFTIARRVQAVFGALCDLLEIYGSPKTTPEEK